MNESQRQKQKVHIKKDHGQRNFKDYSLRYFKFCKIVFNSNLLILIKQLNYMKLQLVTNVKRKLRKIIPFSHVLSDRLLSCLKQVNFLSCHDLLQDVASSCRLL